MDSQKWFPTGRNRKELIENKRAKIDDAAQSPDADANFRREFNWLDSPLDNPKNTITSHSFFATFKDVLPKGETSMAEYVERTLAGKKGSAIGVEFGGIGVKVFSAFTSGFFKESFGVTLVDHRTPPEIARDASIEADRNHHVLVADMLRKDVYQQMEDRLHGQKVDLILERLAGGMSFIPAEPYLLTDMFRRWYTMLDSGGLIFCQTPERLNPLVEKWITHSNENYPGAIECSFELRTNNWSTLRLLKHADAPEDLPLLDPRTVRRVGRRAERRSDTIHE